MSHRIRNDNRSNIGAIKRDTKYGDHRSNIGARDTKYGDHRSNIGARDTKAQETDPQYGENRSKTTAETRGQVTQAERQYKSWRRSHTSSRSYMQKMV